MSSIVVAPQSQTNQAPLTTDTYSASDAVSVLWEATALATRTKPASGQGTEASPYQPSSPAEWLWVATTQRDADTYLQIGGRKVLWKKHDSYVVDQGAVTTVASSSPQPAPQFAIPAAAGAASVSAAGGARRLFTESPTSPDPFGSAEGPTYPAIYRQLARDIENINSPDAGANVARQMKLLLQGQQNMAVCPSSALPVLTAAWFIAEVSRNPCSLGSGLMLLDLIENKKDYTDPNGLPYRYTWEKAIWHPAVLTAEQNYFRYLKESGSKDNPIDLDHVDTLEQARLATKDKVIDLSKEDERSQGLLMSNANLTRDRRGGDHPMGHLDSVAQSRMAVGQKPTQQENLPVVRQKEALIVSRWLATVPQIPGAKVTAKHELTAQPPGKSETGTLLFGTAGKKKLEAFRDAYRLSPTAFKEALRKRIAEW